MTTFIVLHGVYRVVLPRTERNIKEGDICILVRDDGSPIPMFYNPNWDRNGHSWMSIERVEFLGVCEK